MYHESVVAPGFRVCQASESRRCMLDSRRYRTASEA